MEVPYIGFDLLKKKM